VVIFVENHSHFPNGDVDDVVDDGLDQRLNKIERRLGSIEMALTARGISIPPIGGENDKTEK